MQVYRNTGPKALKIQHYTHKYYRCSQILPGREKVNRTVHWTELLLKNLRETKRQKFFKSSLAYLKSCELLLEEAISFPLPAYVFLFALQRKSIILSGMSSQSSSVPHLFGADFFIQLVPNPRFSDFLCGKTRRYY